MKIAFIQLLIINSKELESFMQMNKQNLIKKEEVMKKLITFLMVLSLLSLTVEALAKPLLSVSMKAETDATVNNVTKRIPADKVNSGDIVIYTINFVNTGDDMATNANLDDAIPAGTSYIPGSAFGENADISYSIDGGKTYKKPTLLTYEISAPDGKMEKKVASPEQYTNIRWTISKIPAHGSGQVGFKVKVK